MHVYNKNLLNRFKYKFKGIETVDTNYSQALQDMFVLAVLDGKKNGFFLEIGAYDPVFISNTLLLERFFSWQGISVDIDAACGIKFSNNNRVAKFVHADALKIDYLELLKNHERVDYLSLDIEPNIQTLECLRVLPLDTCRFSVITFETDAYDKQPNSPYVVAESRKIFEEHGYIRVCGNISSEGETDPFEDWYVDPQVISKEVIEKFRRDSDSTITGFDYLIEK